MGFEKDGSKTGGGYVGGFFQLFDWTSKSRKKLFSSKSELPERSKQGKKCGGNLPTTRFDFMDEDETGAGSSVKGSDYSCASSVTDDDGYGARAPGVVARLMGLDSIPTSNFSESYSTPFSDTQSLREVRHHRKNYDYSDHQIMYSGNLRNKVEGSSRYFMESKPQKINKPIEKFQTEVLPPKSAKSIPITHHKLLSPIKNPGFIPTKNAAHIMEAAAKIIESSQHAKEAKAKMPLVGSSSVPLRVRDLKEKVQAAQQMSSADSSSASLKAHDLKERVEGANKTSRPAEAFQRSFESNAAKYLKGQPLNKSWNGSVDSSFRDSPDRDQSSYGSKNKGRSISLAIQAKVNVQRREGLNPSSSRGLVGLKEPSEVKSSIPSRRQPPTHKNLHKKSSTHNASGVLRQNNQKQNCRIDKERSAPKTSTSNLSAKKVLSGHPSYGQQRTLNRTAGSKIGLRKGLEETDSEKGTTQPNMKNFPRKKRSLDPDIHFEKNRVAESALMDIDEKPVKSSPIFEKHFSWPEENKRKSMDVVSFTFTAPLTRSSSGQLEQNTNGVGMDNRGKRLFLDADGMKFSSVGYNVIGGDALSSLLEQKLRDLSYGIESSCNATSTANTGRIVPRLQYNKNQHALHGDKLSSSYDSDLFSNDHPIFRSENAFQGADYVDEVNSKHNDFRKLLDCRLPSPISILEPSFSNESCISSDCTNSSSTEGSKQCSSVQAVEVLGLSSLKKLNCVEADIELSDSASSISTGGVPGKHLDTITVTHSTKSTPWDLEYVREILCNVELMFKDFTLGRSREIINPHLFEQLNSRRGSSETVHGVSKLQRKLLFDCVSECLDLRCRRYVGGGCKSWVKGTATVRRKDRLAEEVIKEISGWKGMGDCMVDELVDKDMSQYGRWLDFEVDEFVLGVEVESQILDSLVDEMVIDILQF
ncbi:uncharacterized protein LOC120011939 isoform X2 [Tripterygium wilfordii]|uniref:uncharacterized protein LOC120011939 isoform X2 n=1 Tax=Tripterygium wilfordii TaxID=458696 RepID=UPI0018F82432|nr:uncharacterized protein LOC120011939 isoform X2 [Tripterygium wilfordii]